METINKKRLSEEQAFQRMATLCARSELCTDDIRRKLDRYELPDGSAERIVERLCRERFVDNSRYAHAFVRDKFRYNRWGARRIEQELRRRHIADTDISDALTEISATDNAETLEDMLRKKLQSTRGKNDYEVFMKLMRFSVARGFSADDAHRCLNRIINMPTEETY